MTALCSTALRPDPLAEALPLVRNERIALALSIALAIALHGVVGVALPERHAPTVVPANALEVIEVTPPEPHLSKPEPEPRAEPAAPTTAHPVRPQSAAAAPAQAAQALTRLDGAEDEPLDLTDAIVTGSAATYAGGTTSSSGTSAEAAHGRSSRGVAGGTPLGTPSAAASTAVRPDRARKAGLLGGLAWSCPFPSEADAQGIDHRVVTLAVRIDATATVGSVSVLGDPGYGFGAAARRCAFSKRWQPALDREGHPTASSLTLRVRFTR